MSATAGSTGNGTSSTTANGTSSTTANGTSSTTANGTGVPDGAAITRPVRIGPRTAPSRVLFGAHVTNLGRDRAIGHRHVAYYARRAAGGAGVVVTETASVHASDWPYERAPLAAHCEDGWGRIAEACRPHGTLVLAGIGHTGAQGSSAYGRSALWAPSRVPDTASRELPMELEPPEIDALVSGFSAAAAAAVRAGTDGVEVDAGPTALLRQFHSGLTNTRTDGYGTDRLRLTREVLGAVRAAIGPDHLVALRLSCDELAPWAGVTAEAAVEQVRDLAAWVDLLVVTRGGPYSASAYRPDGHTAPMFNLDLARRIRESLAQNRNGTQVVLQGSVVDADGAAGAIEAGACDLVEMTRALIADADLVAKVRAGTPERVRPCVLCNQACQVRDNRNPVVTCIADPRSGHETTDPDADAPAGGDEAPASRQEVVVVGAGPAGLEAARVLAGRGRPVRVVEREPGPGGGLRAAVVLPGRDRFARLVAWWEAECARLGVRFDYGTTVCADLTPAAGDPPTDPTAWTGGRDGTDPRRRSPELVLAVGSRPGPQEYLRRPGAVVRTDADLLRGWPSSSADLPDGEIVVLDLVGGPIGTGLAELLAGAGRAVSLVTADHVVGTMLALSGDLADANTRLQQAGVVRRTRRLLREVGPGTAVLEDRFSGAREEIACAVLVHCGHRLPEAGPAVEGAGRVRVGDCVAPRTVLEAVLEARRAALSVGHGSTGDPHLEGLRR